MSDNPNSILMTQAQYARHRNKSPQYIGKLAKAGVLVMRGRLVDVAASDGVLDDKPAERTVPDGQAPSNYVQATLADMVFRAKLRRLEFETRQGKMIEAAIVKERWAAILVVLKERVLAVPDKLAPEGVHRRAPPAWLAAHATGRRWSESWMREIRTSSSMRGRRKRATA